MKVRLTRRAARDLFDISAFIRASNAAAALKVRDAIQRAFARLAVHTSAGRPLTGGRRRFALARHPYLIFYRMDEAERVIEIITIRHAARSPEVD